MKSLRSVSHACGIAGVIALLASPAPAQTRDENWAQCSADDPVASIKGCSAVLDSPEEGPQGQSQALANRGIAYRDIGLPLQAIEDFSRALAIDETSRTARFERGATYQQQGDFERALADYNRLIEIEPNQPDVLFARGALRRLMGDVAGGDADIVRAKGMDPSVAGDMAALGITDQGIVNPESPAGSAPAPMVAEATSWVGVATVIGILLVAAAGIVALRQRAGATGAVAVVVLGVAVAAGVMWLRPAEPQADDVVVAIDNPVATLPASAPATVPAVVPAARTGAGSANWSGMVMLNFDSVTGTGCVDATSYLGGFGVTVAGQSSGTTVSAGTTEQCFHGDVVVPSPPAALYILNNQPVSFSLHFDRALSRITFVRARLNAGLSGVNTVGWTATAYNAAGAPIAEAGEDAAYAYSPEFIASAPFSLAGAGISSVTFVRTSPRGENTSFGVSFPVLDDFVLVE